MTFAAGDDGFKFGNLKVRRIQLVARAHVMMTGTPAFSP
jgi:hypothetical protein